MVGSSSRNLIVETVPQTHPGFDQIGQSDQAINFRAPTESGTVLFCSVRKCERTNSIETKDEKRCVNKEEVT